jgi:hypothetical protein
MVDLSEEQETLVAPCGTSTYRDLSHTVQPSCIARGFLGIGGY